MFSMKRRAAVALFCFLSSSGVARGTELCVMVADDTDAPLLNARINVSRLREAPVADAGGTVKGITAKDGTFCVAVAEGVFSVEVELSGFLTVRYQPVRVIHPYQRKLVFHLPLGESGEGGVESGARVAGILASERKPVAGATICLRGERVTSANCVSTNDFGEYAFFVSPGTYDAEIRMANGDVYRSILAVPHEGYHHNAISLGKRVGH